MLNEVWKDIPQYEGLYQVSNVGRVKALPRQRSNYTGGTWIQSEHIMALTINKKGYEKVALRNEYGVRKNESVHRLVALAFIPNPEGKPEVNHINCVRHDNRVENLEWCSHQENCIHTSVCGNKSNKLIQCIETQQIFNTSTDAAKVNGGDAGNIRKAARDQSKSVYGFHYIYIEKPVFLGEPKTLKND